MSLFKRVLALVIVVVTVFALALNADAAGTVTEEDVWNKIEMLRQIFPSGSIFTANSKKCDSSCSANGYACENCKLGNIMQYNTKAKNAVSAGILRGSRYTCCSFAAFTYAYIFGHDLDNNTSTILSTSYGGVNSAFLSKLRVGDCLKIEWTNGGVHYATFLGYDSNYLYIYDSNGAEECTVAYNRKKSISSCASIKAYRSKTYNTCESVSGVYITHGYKDQTNKITNSNAIVYATVHKPSSAKNQMFGIRIRKTNEWYKDQWDYFHDAMDNGVGKTTHRVWFDLNSELNYTLEPATSYTYQIYALIDDKEYFSTENSFTTTGSTVNHIYKLTAPDGYQTIREHAYTTSAKIYDIPTPNYVTVTKYTDDSQWGYVSYNGYSGWIKLYYVEKHDSHTYGSWSTTSNATCTAAGSQKRTCACGASETQSTPALGHNWSSTWTIDKAATCTAAGSKSHHCARCTAKTDVTAIPAKNHSFGEWKTVTQANCTVAGEQTRKCNNCTKTESKSISAIGHSFGDWTVTKQPTYNETGSEMRTCSGCNKTEAKVIAKLSLDGHTHNYGEWTVTKVAECELPGEETRTCSICSEIETREMSAQGHKFGEWQITIEPTHESEGREERACSLCNTCEQRVVGKISAPETELEIVPETEFEKTDAPDTSDRSDTQSVDSDVLTEDAVQEDTENTEHVEHAEDDGPSSVLIIAVITLAALTAVLGVVLSIVLLKKH